MYINVYINVYIKMYVYINLYVSYVLNIYFAEPTWTRFWFPFFNDIFKVFKRIYSFQMRWYGLIYLRSYIF